MSSTTITSPATKHDLAFAIPADRAPARASGLAMAATVHVPPESVEVRPAVLVCWPGLGYDRDYWDLCIPGRSGYSFAEHLSAQGFVVIAPDPVGVGSSTGPQDGSACTAEALGQAANEVVGEIRERIASGTLVPGLGPIEDATIVGVGHSLGGVLVVAEQSLHDTYDVLAVLGLPHNDFVGPFVDALGENPDPDVMRAQAMELTHAMMGAGLQPGDTYVTPEKAPNQPELIGPDLAPDIAAYDNASSPRWPLTPMYQLLSIGFVEGHAQRVTCPVFVAFGEYELMTPESAHRHVGSYGASSDVTLFVQPQAYHCLNFQESRQVGWDRLGAWASKQAALRSR